MEFVDLKEDYLQNQEKLDGAIKEVILNTAFIGGGKNPYVTKFEKEFGEYIGIDHCVACANGTDALEIALVACGIQKDDEVLVPAISWISSAEAVLNVGAIPVFVDVNYEDCLIDAQLIGNVITDRTKAIIPVHLYGKPADMLAIAEIAKKHRLIVIEDCAQAHGATINGKKVGTFGDAACFSFYPGKNLGAFGDAGAMLFKKEEYAAIARQISNHGQTKKHNHLRVGRNSRLDGIHAAILSVKLDSIDEMNARRVQVAEKYNKLIKESVSTPVISESIVSVFHLYVIKVNNREELQQKFNEEGIPSGIHYPIALPRIPLFNNDKEFPKAEKACSEILSLPIHPYLTEEEIIKVASIVNKYAK